MLRNIDRKFLSEDTHTHDRLRVDYPMFIVSTPTMKGADETVSGPTRGLLEYTQNVRRLPYCPVFVDADKDGSRHYSAHFTGGVIDPHHYLNLVESLRRMQEKDTMKIYIASPGGYICSATYITSAMEACRGHVTTIATGICASAGSLIWSAGHTCKVNFTAQLMYHMSSHIGTGNSIKVAKDAISQVEYIRRVLLDLPLKKGHLTQDEVDLLCKDPNRQVWLDAIEMAKRLKGVDHG